ncbi:MAG TPA: methionyl-tRNA formyltransferase [Acidimicrobiales bacterium]
MARLAFLGTPEMAVPPLRALAAAGHDIALCVTRPDRKRGRGAALSPSPVKAAALELGIPVSHKMDDLTKVEVELAVVVAYGRIIPVSLLEQIPMVNLHFSLLPRWRGAAPVERALLAGDTETGVCLMKVEEGLDTGPVYSRATVRIGDLDLSELRAELVRVGTDLLVSSLAHGPAGLPEPVTQEGEATIADKISKEELELHWSEPALHLQRVVRLGLAWTTFRSHRLRVLKATADPDSQPTPSSTPGLLRGTEVDTGAGVLHLVEVQPESRSPVSAEAWVRGIRPREGERLGTE